MILMQLNQITKSFGAEAILSDIKLEIKTSERIRIVGRNSAGKYTLLNIMTRELNYDEGVIFRRKDMTLGYLAQHTELSSNMTIWNEMLGVFQPLLDQQVELRDLE